VLAVLAYLRGSAPDYTAPDHTAPDYSPG